MPAYRPGVAPDDLELVLERTAPAVWQALRGQRLFITGGTGFVGCWLLEALLWAEQRLGLGLRLTVLTRDATAFHAKAPHLAQHRAVTLVAGSMTDLAAIVGPFDSILHAATDVAAPSADPDCVYRTIVAGTEQALALAQRCQARRFLLTSSGAVYGAQPPELSHVPESFGGVPPADAPAAAYGRAKRASEALLHAAAHAGLATMSARCFALLGPYLPLDAHFAVGNFIRDASAGQPVRVNGDGSAVRSYLYGADLVVWLLTILTEGRSGENYNVGSEHAISIAELAAAVAAQVPASGPVQIAAKPTPGVPAQRYVPHTAKARSSLRLAEYTDLQTALRKTIAWGSSDQGDTAMSDFNARQLRKTVLDMAYAGSTVHIGCAYSIIELLAVLYRRHLRYPGNDPRAALRDYLVLSKGHGVMAQYACLYEKGWLPRSDLERYFSDGSRLKGLSDAHLPGCEVSSGSLGHGLSVGVGLALGAKLSHTDQMCYAIVGDGEMNEGPVWEGMMFATHKGLDNLVVIVDENGFQAMGSTAEVLDMGSLQDKFAAFGFEALSLDGHDEAALDAALTRLKGNKDGRPKAIVARTVKGKGVSFMEHANIWHYTRLSAATYAAATAELEGQP